MYMPSRLREENETKKEGRKEGKKFQQFSFKILIGFFPRIGQHFILLIRVRVPKSQVEETGLTDSKGLKKVEMKNQKKQVGHFKVTFLVSLGQGYRKIEKKNG